MNNHKRSTSTLNGGQNTSYLNTKNDQSLLSKQFETKQNSKILENNNNNKSKYTENNEEPKTLYSTFTGSTNFAKELKNSPLKKTHYNIGEINSKYVAKEKNAVNFSNIEVFLNLFIIYLRIYRITTTDLKVWNPNRNCIISQKISLKERKRRREMKIKAEKSETNQPLEQVLTWLKMDRLQI